MKKTSLLFSLIATMFVVISIGCGPGKTKPKVKRDGGDDSSTVEADDKKHKQVKAKAGVGKQGRKIKDREGLFATPVKAYFKARDKITFMQAEKALQLFEGLNQRYPESHEEYMEKVIQANNLTLPKLPEGDYYEYDVKKKQLMVWTQDQ